LWRTFSGVWGVLGIASVAAFVYSQNARDLFAFVTSKLG
jgi:hypothetical protein